ncbi:hypothetical protein ACGFYM_42020 [Streptomyces sp. NPDC048231]|uniref:hypothetical protein n=1 Tax=Streptomyces sp. NPDC048231 TaxID=3365519 RepID=UPI00372337ED
MEKLSGLLLFTPVEVVRAVLPERIERGDGAVLLTHGSSAVQPMPHFSGVGPVVSAARNYLYFLNTELADTGVYPGTLAIGAGIARSEPARAARADARAAFPMVDPDDLAECYWDMYARRDRVEQLYPGAPAPQTDAA